MSNFFNTLFKSKYELTTEQLIKRKTMFSFFVFFIMIVLGIIFWITLKKQPRDQAGVQAPLRSVLNGNEKVFSKIESYRHLAKTYPKSMAAKKVRVNGNVGLKSDLDTAAWRLHVIKTSGDTLFITLNEIKKLPKTEIIFDFKCIEGWSQVSHWGGVKFSDFAHYFHLEKEVTLKYIGLSTPDEAYYVGIDMPSAMHPQTLVCYEMNGKPLPVNQGFPLRMIVPVKYGIKSLKRIGTMYFNNTRPKDYWFERGYDYYSGL